MLFLFYDSIKPERSILAETILGSPRARCARFGICETRSLGADAWAGFVSASARHVKNKIALDADAQLHFLFGPGDVSAVAQDYFFGNGVFRVDDEKRLSAGICKKLGIERFVIQPGLYPLTMRQDGTQAVCFGQAVPLCAPAPDSIPAEMRIAC